MRRALFLASLAMWVAALAVQALGWTASMSVLSLTTPEGESFEVALMKAVAVLLTWFGAVMVAPVLALTSFVWLLLERAWMSPRPVKQATDQKLSGL